MSTRKDMKRPGYRQQSTVSQVRDGQNAKREWEDKQREREMRKHNHWVRDQAEAEGVKAGGLYRSGKGGFVASLKDAPDSPEKWGVYDEKGDLLRVTQDREKALAMLEEYHETGKIIARVARKDKKK